MLKSSLAGIAALLLATGPVLAAAPKPQPPAIDLPPAPRAEACDETASRKALLDGMDPYMARMREVINASNGYQASLMEWRQNQLLEAKVWTEKDAMAFSEALLADPKFAGFTESNLAEMNVMVGHLGTVMEASEKKDDARACRAVIAMIGSLERVLANTSQQWAYMDARYVAVAREKGLSIE